MEKQCVQIEKNRLTNDGGWMYHVNTITVFDSKSEVRYINQVYVGRLEQCLALKQFYMERLGYEDGGNFWQ